MQDSITREIMVHAPKERVYQAIANPNEITKWFFDRIEGSFEVGQHPVVTFTSENHKTSLYVEAARPHDYFAYRWVPESKGYIGDVLKVPNTLIEFSIEETSGSTKVTVKESGFASLPAAIAEQCFKQNSGGWEYMMGRLQKFVDTH